MARRFRPVLVGVVQALCVAGLVWLVWPETIPMERSAAGEEAPAAARRAPRPVPAGPVYLEGDVLLEGRPVAGRVTLSGPVSAEAVSDESGSFRFELGPTFRWLADRVSDERVVWGREDAMLVTVCADAGAHVACASPEIVLGEVPARLRLQLSLGGLLTGTVVDEHGRPRAGAEVEAAGTGAALRARCAPDGRFALSAPPGRYRVEARAPHTLRELPVPVTLEPSATAEVTLRLWSAAHLSGIVVDPKGARVRFQSVRVRGGQQPTGRAEQPSKGRFVADGLVPGPYRIEVEAEGFVTQEFDARAPADDLRLVLQPGLSVVGTVFDVDGLPHEGARVAALPEERMNRVLGSTHTDAYGSFRIDGIAPGAAYYIVAMSEPKQGESTVCAAERVIVFERTSGLNLRFEPGRSIGGQVVDSRGRGVPDAWVEAFPEGIARVQSPIAPWRATFARSDGNGNFSLGHLRFDRYRISARHGEYAWRTDSHALASTGDTKVRLVLSEQGAVRGRVLLPDGAPATEFAVNGRLVRGSDGWFSAPVQRGPTVELAFKAQGFAQEVRQVQADREVEITVDDVVLSPPRTVEGVVTDRATGKPISGAAVRLAAKDLPDTEEARSHGDTPEVRTDARGRFSLADAPPLGTLVVRKSGYRSAAAALSPEVGRHEISLETGAVVSGRVVVSSRLGALTKASLVLRTEDRLMSGEVAPDGTFSVSGLHPGRWQVHLLEPDRELEVLPRAVDVPAGGLAGLTLSMRDGGAAVTVTGLFDQWAFLAPGQVAPPRGYAAYRDLWRQSIPGEQGLDGALFRSVEPGQYTLFVGQEEPERHELGFYTMGVEVRGREPQTFPARAPKFVTTLPIPPGAP